MKLRLSSAFLMGGLLSLFCVSAGSAADPAPSDTDPSAKEAKAKTTKTPLAKGMTPDEVLKIAGKPDEVRRIKNPQAKAEVWVYRRVLDRKWRDTAATVMERPAFQGPGPSGEGIAIDPVMRQERVTIYQVTWVLMINDRVEYAKQTREAQRSFD